MTIPSDPQGMHPRPLPTVPDWTVLLELARLAADLLAMQQRQQRPDEDEEEDG
jgi:hypothetical protein